LTAVNFSPGQEGWNYRKAIGRNLPAFLFLRCSGIDHAASNAVAPEGLTGRCHAAFCSTGSLGRASDIGGIVQMGGKKSSIFGQIVYPLYLVSAASVCSSTKKGHGQANEDCL